MLKLMKDAKMVIAKFPNYFSPILSVLLKFKEKTLKMKQEEEDDGPGDQNLLKDD